MKAIFPLMLLALVCTSCSKKLTRSDDPKDFKYTISHPQSIMLYQYHDTVITLPITVRHLFGPQQYVHVELSTSASSIKIDHTSWNAIPDTLEEFQITCNTDKDGVYPITITDKSATGQLHTSFFDIHVQHTGDCSVKLSGKYTEVRTGKEYDVIIGKSVSELIVRDIFLPTEPPGNALDTFQINCASKSLSGRTISASFNEKYAASGSFSNDTIRLLMRYYDYGWSDYPYTLKRKK